MTAPRAYRARLFFPIAVTLVAGLLSGIYGGLFRGRPRDPSPLVPSSTGDGRECNQALRPVLLRHRSRQVRHDGRCRCTRGHHAGGNKPGSPPTGVCGSADRAGGWRNNRHTLREPPKRLVRTHAAAGTQLATSGRIPRAPSPASVTLNGHWRGRTPLTLDGLPFGSYVERVMQDGSKPGAGVDVDAAGHRALALDHSGCTRKAGRGQPPVAEPARRDPHGTNPERRLYRRAVHRFTTAGRGGAARRPSLGKTPIGCRTFRSARTSCASSWRSIRNLDGSTRGHRREKSPRHRFARTTSMKATLALENGIWYEGEAAGAAGETGGEVVFNTSMTGYQEVLTDPSYAGQIVTMTSPEIGNYGIAGRGRRVARRRRSPASSSATNRRSRATGAPTARCATISSATTSSRSPTSTRAR